MKEDKTFILKSLNIISIIILYYIIGSKSIFLYVLSLSLYNIFISCFDYITIKPTLQSMNNTSSKKKIFRITLFIISFISILFMLMSVLISDLLSIFLKIDNILIVFIMMSLTIVTKPGVKLLSEYLENIKHNHHYQKLIDIYQELDYLLLLIIALLIFRLFNLNINIAVALLYLSKIISFIIVIGTIYFLNSPIQKIKVINKDNLNYFKEIKKILTKNASKSTINIVKNSYYYISIIILYLVLSTRYNYKLDELEKIITFVYFYALTLIDYLIYLAKLTVDELPKDMPSTDKIYNSFKTMLPIAIIFGIISPLTCKVIFYDTNKSLYLVMVNFMAIFVLLYELTFSMIKNKRIVNISLIIGIIIKIILVIPLINAFYRMGYSLVYGDILSTIIAMFISVIVNYIYLKKSTINKISYFDKILNILYENILLCIILILTQFIIPIDTSSYFKSLGLIIIYLIISIAFIKIKNKKRG